MSPTIDWLGGLAPFVLAALLVAFAMFSGRLTPSLRQRVATIGGGIIAATVTGFGAMLIVRGLGEQNPAVWARGLAMVMLILCCLGVVAVRARAKADNDAAVRSDMK